MIFFFFWMYIVCMDLSKIAVIVKQVRSLLLVHIQLSSWCLYSKIMMTLKQDVIKNFIKEDFPATNPDLFLVYITVISDYIQP